jgi:Transposase DDE domain
MDLDDLIIASFCEIDDAVKQLVAALPKARLRGRGAAPTLCDSEVLCMEVIGAYLGLEQDRAIYDYFVHHYSSYFPSLPKIHRTTFTRQAANLAHLKERLWQHWLQTTPHQNNFGLIDSLPLPVCRFARATFCRRFRYEEIHSLRATYGYDHVARQTFWGLRLHLHVAWPGLIARLTLAPAHQSDVAVAPQMLNGQNGLVIGDRNYHSPELQEQLRRDNPHLKLLTPFKSKKADTDPKRSTLLSHFRYRIETVHSQLCTRFGCKQIWARDVWHLVNRLLRIVLSHTLCFRLNLQRGNSPLQFAKLTQ